MSDEGMIALRRLSNILMSESEIKRAVTREAERLAAAHFEVQYSAHAAKTLLQKELAKWIHDNGFTGHSVNKLVGKAIGHALRGYDHRLRLILQRGAAEGKKHGCDYRSKKIEAGIIGRGITQRY